jgi:hypothetical protein
LTDVDADSGCWDWNAGAKTTCFCDGGKKSFEVTFSALQIQVNNETRFVSSGILEFLTKACYFRACRRDAALDQFGGSVDFRCGSTSGCTDSRNVVTERLRLWSNDRLNGSRVRDVCAAEVANGSA